MVVHSIGTQLLLTGQCGTSVRSSAMNLAATDDVRVPTVSSIVRGSFARRRVRRVESWVMGQNDQGDRSTQSSQSRPSSVESQPLTEFGGRE